MATLTANLVLDTSGFTSGIDKARGAAGRYQQEMSRAAQAIRGLEANIRVLELQSSGYDQLASSLKNTLNIEAQAQRLAQSGIVTKESALALLQKQSLLQRNIATQEAENASKAAAAQAAAAQQAQQAAAAKAAEILRQKNLANEIERARAAAERYNIESTKAAVALKSVEQNITMLRMQASGHDALAASMKASLELEARAEKLSKDAQITKKQAIALLEEERLLITNIANQKARAAEIESAAAAKQAAAQKAASRTPREIGLPDLPLTDEYIRKTERAAFVAQDARNQFNRLSRGIGGTSMGFLAFSQAVEDAQYGIKGVLNNIPQMIMGFGGSMGLAGALSLAAVAAVSLYPLIKKLYGAVDNEILKESADEWGKVFKEGVKAAQEAYNSTTAAKKLKEVTESLVQRYREIYNLGKDFSVIQRQKIESLESEKDILDEIFDLRAKIALAEGRFTQEQIDEARNKKELKFIEDKIKLLEEEQKYINNRQGDAINKLSLNKELDQEQSSKDEEKKRDLQVNLSSAKANLSGAEKEIEKMTSAGISGAAMGNAMTNARLARESIAVIEEEIKAHEINAKSSADARSATITYLEGEIKALDDKNQKSREELKSLQSLIQAKRELQGLNKKEKELEKQKELKDGRDEYKYELDMIKARIAGDEAEIARLERKKAIEEEIIRLKELGAKPTSKELDSAVESEKRIQNEIQKLQDKGMTEEQARNKIRLNELWDAEDRAAKRTNSGFEPKTPTEYEFAYKQAEKRRKEIDALINKGASMGFTEDAERLLQLMEIQKRKQQEINNLKKESSLESQAAKIVDSRNKANEADKQRKDNAQTSSGGGGVSPGKLGSVARFNNLMMGRAANDGLLDENRRQTNLLRTIEKNTATKQDPKQVFVPVFASGY